MAEYQVLMIDDDEDDFVIIKALLDDARIDRYAVTWVNEYESGLQELLCNTYDVCLLDFRIDHRTGVDLLKAAMPKGCITPVVVFTGHGDISVDEAAMSAGASDYLGKDQLTAGVLERTIRHAVDRADSWKRIQRSEAKQRAMLASIPDTVVRVSPDGTILDYRPGHLRRQDETMFAAGASLADVFGPPAGETLGHSISAANQTGDVQTCTFCVEGMMVARDYEARVVAIEDADDAVVIIREYTDEKPDAKSLESLVQARDRFLDSMSHRIRTPLTTVLGYADLLCSEWDTFSTDEMKSIVGAIGRESVTIGEVFEDALVMARYETDRLVIVPVPVDLAAYASRAAERLAPGLEAVGPTDATEVFAVADPRRLTQILRHLISNASVERGQHVLLSVGVADGVAWVQVAEEGPGVPHSEAAGVSDIQGGLDPVDLPLSGDVGLTVARRLARLMDGDLIYDRTFETTRLRLELPAADRMDASKDMDSAVGELQVIQ